MTTGRDNDEIDISQDETDSRVQKKLEQLVREFDLHGSERSARAEAMSTELHSRDRSERPEVPPGEDVAPVVKASIGIVDAYHVWCGKMTPKGAGVESIMVSCPMPGHADKKPSAWLNSEKDVGFCAVCQWGFDQLDLAAIKFGYDPRTYKKSGQFGDVLFKAGRSIGLNMESVGAFTGIRLANGELFGIPVDIDVEVESSEDYLDDIEEQIPSEEVVLDESTVTSIEYDTPAGPLIQSGSFLDLWLQSVRDSREMIPSEFQFATGLIALGQAVGRNAVFNHNVYANPSIVLYGNSGSRKSTAVRHLRNLLRDALPWDDEDPINCSGSKWVEGSGSGEDLVDRLARPKEDPDGNPADPEEGIRGVVVYDEFESLIKRANRLGSTITGTLMAFVDADPYVSVSSRTGGTRKAEDTLVSALSTTQPRAIASYLDNVSLVNGFLNRWMFFSGVVPERADSTGAWEHDEAALALRSVRGWSSVGQVMEFEHGAQSYFNDYLRDNIDPILNDYEQDTGSLTRVEIHMLRMMMLIAINERTNIVTENTVRRVIQWGHQYLIPNMRQTEHNLTHSEFKDIEQRIRRALGNATAGSLTVSNLRRNDRTIKRCDNLDKHLATLVKLNVIEKFYPAFAQTDWYRLVKDEKLREPVDEDHQPADGSSSESEF